MLLKMSSSQPQGRNSSQLSIIHDGRGSLPHHTTLPHPLAAGIVMPIPQPQMGMPPTAANLVPQGPSSSAASIHAQGGAPSLSQAQIQQAGSTIMPTSGPLSQEPHQVSVSLPQHLKLGNISQIRPVAAHGAQVAVPSQIAMPLSHVSINPQTTLVNANAIRSGTAQIVTTGGPNVSMPAAQLQGVVKLEMIMPMARNTQIINRTPIPHHLNAQATLVPPAAHQNSIAASQSANSVQIVSTTALHSANSIISTISASNPTQQGPQAHQVVSSVGGGSRFLTVTPSSAGPIGNSSASGSSIVGSGSQSNSGGSQTSSNSSQFQRLKVEDALSYLDQVKFRFGSQPQVYNDFLDIMKEFKSQSIDTPGVIQRVSTLFKGHPELIVGFNTFLPPGYKIEMQSNDTVNVSMPHANILGGGTQHHQIHLNATPSGPISSNSTSIITTGRHPVSASQSSHVNNAVSTISDYYPSKQSQGPVLNSTRETSVVVKSERDHSRENSQNIPEANGPIHHGLSNSLVVAATNGGQVPGHQGSPPVEFNHAINYVNKIKHRFQYQPDVYKSFLEILHTYQKEQKNIKDGIQPNTRPLSESEVYSQVARLFKNHEDLLAEFSQFLPEANGIAGITFGSTGPFSAVGLGNHSGPDNLSVSTNRSPNDHIPIVKKPLHGRSSTLNSLSGPEMANANALNASYLHPRMSLKRNERERDHFPNSSQIKRPRMTSLRDVTLAEAGKYGSLTEFAFFDKVRKVIKDQSVYENFLRALLLYNHEIVTRSELIQLITPALGKHPELLKWFKDFLGSKENSSFIPDRVGGAIGGGISEISTITELEGLPNRVLHIRDRERERLASEAGMDIDYSTCKRYGASYRALPKSHLQPKCTGRTALCREVLNDTWVSFPSWSEDSTFVTSRKTAFEEYIYRCEDERFELDVVIESNLSTIRTLEAVNKKIARMSTEERAKFKLDDCLGGTSTVIHQRSIKRIYGEKAGDIIEGLKKNPAIAVPLVLRRLKSKEEEWREAQKQFNKVWREQNEKYYLKSLDHQGITFKQNDIKTIRSKTLISEMELAYTERQEKNEDLAAAGEENVQPVVGPHITVSYSNKNMIEEACNIIIHHVKRQTGIHKEDKQRVKQLLRQFVPDLFNTNRGELSDDEVDDADNESEDLDTSQDMDEQPDIPTSKSHNESQISSPPSDARLEDAKIEIESQVMSKDTSAPTLPNPTSTKESDDASAEPHNTSPPSQGSQDSATCENDGTKETETVEEMKIMAELVNSIPDDTYTMFIVNNNWYLFFRLHHILCERLSKMYDRAQIIREEEFKERRDRHPDKTDSTAIALRLRPKPDIQVEEYFPAFVDMVKQVLDGNLDGNQYEDQLREMFGIHAYLAFTMDKLVQNIVRQLQHIVSDETCVQCQDVFQEESKRLAAGGPCDTHYLRADKEIAYQRKMEQILAGENCYKVIFYHQEAKITYEMIDTDSGDDDSDSNNENDDQRVDLWADYVEQYASNDSIPNHIKDHLAQHVRFLLKNVRQYKRLRRRENDQVEEQASPFVNGKAVPPSLPNRTSGNLDDSEDETQDRDSDTDLNDSLQCKFNPNSYRIMYVVASENHLIRKGVLKRARLNHERISKIKQDKFHSWHRDRLKRMKITEQVTNKFESLLCGTSAIHVSGKDERPSTANSADTNDDESGESMKISTEIAYPIAKIKISNEDRPPYRTYFKYTRDDMST